MARKSRRANIVQEKKEELHISTSIITRRQLATAAYARLSVDKEKNDESIQNQIELLHQYIREHEEYSLVDTYVDAGKDLPYPSGWFGNEENEKTSAIYYGESS